MNEITVLRADEVWFSAHAKDLIIAKAPFQFVVSGQQAEALRGFLVDGQLLNVHRMAVDRLVRPILVVALFANAAGRSVRFAESDRDIIGTVFGLATEPKRRSAGR